MRTLDVVGLSLTRLRASWLESLLVAFGLGLGIAVIASTLSFYRVVDKSVSNDRMASEISAHITRDDNPRDAAVRKITQTARTDGDRLALVADDVAAGKNAAPAVSYGYFGAQVSDRKGSGAEATVVMGDYFRAFGLKTAEGRLFDDSVGPGERVAVLGARKARLLGPKSGAVGAGIQVFGLDYTVVGILAPLPASADNDGEGFDDRIFIPLRSSLVYEKLKGMPEITFSVPDTSKLATARDQLRSYFDAKYGAGSIEVSARTDEAEAERSRIAGVLAVLLTFALAALLVANTNMLNVMLARGVRRTKAAGISFALGQSRAGLFRLDMVESLLLGAAGVLLAFGVSWGLIALIKQLFVQGQGRGDATNLVLDGAYFALSALGGLVLNALIGLYPAWRATRLRPADAMRID